MKVSVLPEGAVILTGRVERKTRTLLHLVLPPVSLRDARRLEKLCNSGTRSSTDQLHLSWGIFDTLQPFFCSDNQSTTGLRILNGATILRVMNNRPPAEIGDFAPVLYQRAEKRLRSEQKLSRPLNGYAELESLFAAAIARELPSYWENWKTSRSFSELDGAFIRIMTRDWTAIAQPVTQSDTTAVETELARTHFQFLRPPHSIQLGLPLEEGELIDRLQARVRRINDVCSEPLTHARRAPREESTTPAKPLSEKARKAARKRADEIGYFVDFTGRLRPIPILNPATVEGIAQVDGVLDASRRYTKDDYLKVARAATDHRCKSGVGGPVIVPESAEFYVRLFRAIHLTQEELDQVSREELSKLTVLAARLHRLQGPSDEVASARS
jgi:hypothetical protein